MTRWLITGAAGMLGRDLVALLSAKSEEVTGLVLRDLGVTGAAAVAVATTAVKPDMVVNCAAWTAIDGEAREDDALAINGHTAHLPTACPNVGAAMVQVSTDYVFAATASEPYAEDLVPAPRTACGRIKLARDRAVLATLPDAAYLARTAWLYGPHVRSFVATIVDRALEGTAVRVVDDQHGQPTWTPDVVDRIVALISSGAPAASTTRRVPARRPGLSSPPRCTSCSLPTPRSSARSQPAETRVSRRTLPTALLGRGPGSSSASPDWRLA